MVFSNCSYRVFRYVEGLWYVRIFGFFFEGGLCKDYQACFPYLMTINGGRFKSQVGVYNVRFLLLHEGREGVRGMTNGYAPRFVLGSLSRFIRLVDFTLGYPNRVPSTKRVGGLNEICWGGCAFSRSR